jgi:cation diffusion facilitator CzcD-associated flavoprotein CzcO
MANKFQAVVIGAGPAGIATVARLIDINYNRIAWIDPHFQGGRLQRYPQVPSNTRVQLFLKFAQVSPILCKGLESSPTARALLQLPQNEGCDLSLAQGLCADLIQSLRQDSRIQVFQNWVKQVEVHSPNTDQEKYQLHLLPVDQSSDDDKIWDTISVNSNAISSQILADELFMCTGSTPISCPPSPAPHEAHPSVQVMHLDVALYPSKLKPLLASEKVVAVVGSSHSAVLCVKNVVEQGGKVVHLTRHPLMYAADMPGGWILRDNTGLKGIAANWARTYLENSKSAEQVGVTQVKLGADEAATYAQYLPTCAYVVYAIGFKNRQIPTFILPQDGKAIQTTTVEHCPKTGMLTVGGSKLQRARGFGIAFPEQVVDPHGNVETSVGMWKFMRYVQEVVSR